jgi:hypothetical protein
VVRFQEVFLKSGAIEKTYRFIRRETLEKFDDDLLEEKEELLKNCLALLSAISDCCDLPDFEEHYPFQQIKGQLISFIRSDDTNVQLLGCILVGNYAKSEDLCKAIISADAHRALVQVVTESNDARILHASLGALKNLAIPPLLRTQLAEPNTIHAAAKIWNISVMPQVQLVSVSLVRLLITESTSNITNYLLRNPNLDAPQDMTHIFPLLSLFSKTDSLPIKLEIGRTLAEVFRCLASADDADPYELEEAYERLFTLHSGLLRPIGVMVSQSQYLPVRSEAFFILALICHRREGCVAVRYILQDADVFGVVVETVTGKLGEGLKDRENIVVMASEMVRNGEGAFLTSEEVEKLVQGMEVEGVYERLNMTLEGMRK